MLGDNLVAEITIIDARLHAYFYKTPDEYWSLFIGGEDDWVEHIFDNGGQAFEWISEQKELYKVTFYFDSDPHPKFGE